jgi:uncharacterized protein YjdB
LKKHKSYIASTLLALITGTLLTTTSPQQTHAADTTTYRQMYRLYQKNNGEHFYTASTHERDSLVKHHGWQYEGIGWTAPTNSNTPVYRLYNKSAGDHHYTTSKAEKNHLIKVGWQYEGIGWYSSDSKAIGLHRLYNPKAKAGSHHYTTSANEKNNLAQKHGWKYEGMAWYGIQRVTNITLNSLPKTMTTGASYQPTVTIAPANASNKTYSLTSSNPSIIAVSGKKLIAKNAGQATITAKSSDGGKISKTTITVSKPAVTTPPPTPSIPNPTIPVQSIVLRAESTQLQTGDVTNISTTVSPWNATNKTISYSNSNPSVVSLSGTKLHAKKPGQSTITVKTQDGNKTSSITIMVSPKLTSIIRKPNFPTDNDLATNEVWSTPIYWDNRGKHWDEKGQPGTVVNNQVFASEKAGMWYVSAEMLPTVEVMEHVKLAQFHDEYFSDGQLIKTEYDYDIVAMRNLIYENNPLQPYRHTVNQKFMTYDKAEAYAKANLANKPAYCIRETGLWRNSGVTPVKNYYVVDYFDNYKALDAFQYYGGDGTGYSFENNTTLGEYECLFTTEAQANSFMNDYLKRQGVVKVVSKGKTSLAYGSPYAEKIIWTRNGKKIYHISAKDYKQDAVTFNSIFDEKYFGNASTIKSLQPTNDLVDWNHIEHRFTSDMKIPDNTPTYFR